MKVLLNYNQISKKNPYQDLHETMHPSIEIL